MPSTVAVGFDLLQRIKDLGVEIPAETCSATLEMPVDGVVQLVLRVNVSGTDLIRIGAALAAAGNYQK
jgi:hypothetical protein